MSFNSRDRYPNGSDSGPVISAPIRAQLPTNGHDDTAYNLAGYEDSASRAGRAAGSTYANSEYNADVPENEQPKGNRFFRTRKRMCLCICCLLLLIILAVVIPVVIFVIVPAIAQSSVNGSKMVVTSSNITAPQENSFIMKMAGKVTDTGAFDAQIEIKDKVKMYYEGVELGQMAMDPIDAKSGVGATLDASPTFEITDVEAFGKFSKVMMTSEEFTWTMKGDARVRAMGLTIDNIKLQKDLTFKGMQGFPGVKIKSFDLPSNHPLGGITMNVESTMDNPSAFGVELGDLTFDIKYSGLRIVTANVTGVNLVPGENLMSMKGRMVPQPRSEDMAIVNKMFGAYMTGKSSDMSVIGVAVRPNATAKPIPWLQAGFEGLTLKVTLDSKEKGDLIQSLELGSMDMRFTEQTAWSPSTSAPNVVARFRMPFGFPMEMKQVAQEITVYDGGNGIARLSVPLSPAKGSSASGQMSTALTNVPMNVVPGQNAQFSRFLRDVTVSASKAVTMRGTVSVVAGSAIGDIKLDGVKLDQPVTLQGLRGLSTGPVIMSDVRVTGGTSTALIISLTTTLTNPSNLALSTGTVYFQIATGGQVVGRAEMANMQLKPGVNTSPSTFYFEPSGNAALLAGKAMLNNFVAGVSHPVSISGYSGSTKVASLQQGLSEIRLSSSVPSKGDKMLVGTTYSINMLTVLFTKKSKVTVTLYNPLDAPVSLITMKATASTKGQKLGVIDHRFATPLVLPPKGTVTSPALEMALNINPQILQIVLTAPNGELSLDIDSSLTALIGAFPVALDYKQNAVRGQRVSE
ncbi:hypothetical protein THASP1DRAFT_23623 [Thamnocephalis sphaerospora]|uniref:Tag1-like fifth Ig-like domain-containing protein n=1 Tax=Thamnocephalis sphaerospora TaxID=78915 RepID=A0A4P9XS65_9FUNG|nr:hypothetical protein THASP1DRAFT_23623 [Thamnocephalis sphaerospora]|eukprot:RKP08371.1 hypothetical protein THASP1DRAFT_23623 [Thamnocephalis sphaerospora]